jgi:hypothetical protein
MGNPLYMAITKKIYLLAMCRTCSKWEWKCDELIPVSKKSDDLIPDSKQKWRTYSKWECRTSSDWQKLSTLFHMAHIRTYSKWTCRTCSAPPQKSSKSHFSSLKLVLIYFYLFSVHHASWFLIKRARQLTSMHHEEIELNFDASHSGGNDRFCARLKTDISASNSGLWDRTRSCLTFLERGRRDESKMVRHDLRWPWRPELKAEMSVFNLAQKRSFPPLCIKSTKSRFGVRNLVGSS